MYLPLALWAESDPPKTIKTAGITMVLGGGGGKAPKAPKMMDLKLISTKNSGINENFMNILLISFTSALSHISMISPKRGASGRLKHMKRQCVYKVSEQERKRGAESQGIRITKYFLQKKHWFYELYMKT